MPLEFAFQGFTPLFSHVRVNYRLGSTTMLYYRMSLNYSTPGTHRRRTHCNMTIIGRAAAWLFIPEARFSMPVNKRFRAGRGAPHSLCEQLNWLTWEAGRTLGCFAALPPPVCPRHNIPTKTAQLTEKVFFFHLHLQFCPSLLFSFKVLL